MARTYILGGKNPPRAAMPKGKVKPTGWLEGDDAKDDEDIPLHRKVGDQLNFPYADTMRIGTVIAVKDHTTCLIESDNDIFFERGQDITFLPESACCTHCGQYAFLCDNECPAKKRKPSKRTNNMAKKQTLNVTEVLEIEPGDDDNAVWVNDVVNAVVTNVKEASGKGPVKATLVNAEDNGDKITAIFWKRDFSKIERLEGKLVAFEGGMIRSEYKPKQGPRIQQLAIQAKCEIEVIGEAADSGGSLPHKPSPDRDTPVNAPKRQETASGGSLVTARKAICEKFMILGLVNKAYEAMKDDFNLPEMTGGELSTFATGVGISLIRGESLPQSVFADVKDKPHHSTFKKEESFEDGMEDENIPFKDAAPANKPQSTERGLESWKTCAHPRRKNDEGEPLTIGEMTEADRLKYCRWAASTDGADVDKGDKLFYANLKMLMASKGWTPSKLLAVSLLETEGYGEAFTDEDVSKATQAELDKDLDDLDDDEALQVLGNFDAFIEEVIKAAKKPAKPAKKGKASMPD